MKIQTLFAVLSATVALASAAHGESQVYTVTDSITAADRWVMSYYKNPRPDDFVEMVTMLSRDNEISERADVVTNVGFFATIFAQNPSKVDGWLDATLSLPEADRRVLAAAAWQAGHARGARILNQYRTVSMTESEKEQITALLAMGAKPIKETTVTSEETMQLHWGAFLADGDEKHVLAVLAAFGSRENNLSSAARYSLAMNAANNERVLQVIQAQLEKQPAKVREELRAALNTTTAPAANGT